MVKVYLNSVRLIDRDPNGAGLIVVGEREAFLFEGEGVECAAFLATEVSIGVSVTVRHEEGLRSCMNKPSLWPDVCNYN